MPIPTKLPFMFSVERVFISIGANDIRHCYGNGIRHLRRPIKLLSKKVQLCFPTAKIYFQSLLPMPLKDSFVVGNVLDFNWLLYNICRNEHIYYHDIFWDFVWPDGHRSSVLFEPSMKNCHLNRRGMGQLAIRYMLRIHSKQFNPLNF